MATKTFSLAEYGGGTYYVNAVHGDVKAKSNEVEVPKMTISMSSAVEYIEQVDSMSLVTTINVANPIAGTYYVRISTQGAPNYGALQAKGTPITGNSSKLMIVNPIMPVQTGPSAYAIGLTRENGEPVEYSGSGTVTKVYFCTAERKVLAECDITRAGCIIGISQQPPFTQTVVVDTGSEYVEMGNLFKTFSVGGVSKSFNPAGGGSSATFEDVPYGEAAIAWSARDGAASYYLYAPPEAVTVKSLQPPVLSYNSVAGQLEWEDVEGATSYEVYKDGELLGTVDTAGKFTPKST